MSSHGAVTLGTAFLFIYVIAVTLGTALKHTTVNGCNEID